jgi:hypothetical protein
VTAAAAAATAASGAGGVGVAVAMAAALGAPPPAAGVAVAVAANGAAAAALANAVVGCCCGPLPGPVWPLSPWLLVAAGCCCCCAAAGDACTHSARGAHSRDHSERVARSAWRNCGLLALPHSLTRSSSACAAVASAAAALTSTARRQPTLDTHAHARSPLLCGAAAVGAAQLACCCTHKDHRPQRQQQGRSLASDLARSAPIAERFVLLRVAVVASAAAGTRTPACCSVCDRVNTQLHARSCAHLVAGGSMVAASAAPAA